MVSGSRAKIVTLRRNVPKVVRHGKDGGGEKYGKEKVSTKVKRLVK